MDYETIAWAIRKLAAFGVANNTEENAMMMDRLLDVLMTQKDTVANTYVGKLSGKLHLEVRGITLATEGDLCRDTTLSTHSERWTAELLSMVRDGINGEGI